MSTGMKILAAALAMAAVGTARAASKPAVAFYGYAPHAEYVVKPLKAMGVEVGTIARGKLAEGLAENRYHAVVVSTLTDAERQTIETFLERGGGVLACNPSWHPREEDFGKTCEWLAGKGARPRWEMVKDGNASNVVQVTFGSLSWSDQVAAPVNQGIRGLLTVLSSSTTGWEPPMSYEFGPEWTVTVRGAASMRTEIDKRNDPSLQAWLPKAGISNSPALMGVRDVAKGRLAAIPFRDHWIFAPPPNCPPTEAMLSREGDKPSDWLKLFANTFRWLAEPGLKAGWVGAVTPADLLTPPAQVWEVPATLEWAATGEKAAGVGPVSALPDMPQHAGLIGARTALSSGSGSVADYVKAAREAGLKFLVFFEDSLKMEQAGWDQLVKDCTALSDDQFVAVPGLSYEDAQGNHLYVLGDKVLFPKPAMLLPDKRLDTARANRCDAYFEYVNELVGQKALTGFWRHKENQIHWRDYKLYNSFPIVSFVDGKQVDDALPEYLDWMAMGGCQAVMALEVMSKPAQVAERAKAGWRVIWNRELKDLSAAVKLWHRGAFSFCGMGAQYISSGPSILVWSSPNNLIGSNGQWWRPDLWEYRLRFRVASGDGLRAVTLHDGNRQVLRRWLPAGAKTFEQDLVLANCQQLGLTLEVEDIRGGKAVSTGYWNRNLNQEEFFCSDRCNILGSARLRLKSNGTQYWTPVGFQGNMGCTPSKGRLNLFVNPAVGLTANSPTIPVDGQPLGLPPITLDLNPRVPGEIGHLFTTPATYLASPELVVGQYGFELAYDPAEEKAGKSPLGHAYTQPQQGHGNAWSSWHQLIPTRVLKGWARQYSCNWLTQGLRIGWLEVKTTLKQAVPLEGKGIPIGYTQGIVYRDGQALTGTNVAPSTGTFGRGTFACMESGAGAVVVVGMGEGVSYKANGLALNFLYGAGKPELAAGAAMDYTIAFAGADGRTPLSELLAFAEAFGVAKPGQTAYKPAIKKGKILDTYLTLKLEAQDGAVDFWLPKTALPGFLTASVDKLNDRWSVHVLDRTRAWPNHRALPIRDGRAHVQLDLTDADMDLFIGHPVVADNPEVTLQVSWMENGKWSVEAHNPTDKPIRAKLQSQASWTRFAFADTAELAAGTSRSWVVQEK